MIGKEGRLLGQLLSSPQDSEVRKESAGTQIRATRARSSRVDFRPMFLVIA